MDSAAQFHTPGLTSLSMAFNLQAKSMSNLCIIVQHDFCGDVKHWGMQIFLFVSPELQHVLDFVSIFHLQLVLTFWFYLPNFEGKFHFSLVCFAIQFSILYSYYLSSSFTLIQLFLFAALCFILQQLTNLKEPSHAFYSGARG